MLHLTAPTSDGTPIRAAFRVAGAAALCSPAIEAACAQELIAAKRGTKESRLELIEALDAYLDQASEYVAVPFEEALSVVRRVAPVLHALYPTPESAEKGVGKVYRRLFSGDSVLALSAEDARRFFVFVREVLAATAQGVLRHNRVLATANEGLAEHAPYLTAAVSALTTHDAKKEAPKGCGAVAFCRTRRTDGHIRKAKRSSEPLMTRHRREAEIRRTHHRQAYIKVDSTKGHAYSLYYERKPGKAPSEQIQVSSYGLSRSSAPCYLPDF